MCIYTFLNCNMIFTIVIFIRLFLYRDISRFVCIL